jgi:polyhydroxyalkanoate synthesis regulator phasin
VSLKVCIPGMVERGEITPEQAKQMEEIYDQIEAQYRPQMSESAAAAKASQETVDQLAAEVFQRKRQAVMQIAAQRSALDNMASYPGSKGAAAMALLDGDGKATYSNVEGRRKAILGRSHAMMEGVLARHRRRVYGVVRDRAGLRNLVREAFGEDTGSIAAKELADAWAQTAEMLRKRFNAAGGAIGKLDKWGMPQVHNSVAVRKAGFQAWNDFIAPRLDLSKMADDVSGAPLTQQGLRATLQNVFDTIRTDGWINREPGKFSGQGKIANRRADSRFLVFKDADSWLEYQEQFGASTPFDAMMGHIGGMSRDIAMMEVLGPNPTATVRYLKDTVQKDAAIGDGTEIDSARSANKRIDEIFDTISGAANTPINAKWAARLQGTRSVLTSAMLGGATLSAATDVAFQAVTRRFNGLPVTGSITGYVKLLRPWMSKDQKLAIRLGLIAEEASKMAAAQNRYIGESVGPEIASRLADGVLRASGLSPWTQAGRWAFGMETLGHIADQSHKRFSELKPAFRGMLERYGIGSKEWTDIRATPLYEERGASFLRPQDVKDERLGDRLLEMIQRETDFAVPTATVRARSMLNAGQPGTWMGEIVRNAVLFKSFGISMLMTHGARMMEQKGFNRLKYAAGLTITTTLMGALAMQLKDISKGEDPRPMGDPRFWGQAMLQGGGLGIFGDFITSTESRFGSGLGETVAGPVVGLASDVADATVGNAIKGLGKALGYDMKPDFAHDSVRIIKRYTPGGSLWYSRLAFQRTMLDQMQEMVDPGADEAFFRMEKRAADTGQHYYWEPGEAMPDRAPSTADMFEAMPQ